ncbi:hypothetical protein Rwratislav_15523 [Rhodococcus wratislaviensis IFP 2016]|nr:hypothetical protein Rwratislav_15523 [Rhodococcus wratislaviensis IFP 2016]
MTVAAHGTANADHTADPCQLGWSNVGPRTCAQTEVRFAPVWSLGDGICAGMLTASGTAFDGPLWQYSEAEGAVHSVELRIAQGFSPLGEWAPTVLACDVTAIVRLAQPRHGGKRNGEPICTCRPHEYLADDRNVDTGPGRVRLTIRTDHPNTLVDRRG